MFFNKVIRREVVGTTIEYGIIYGNSTFVILKAGQDGSIYGYENKYYVMAEDLNREFGVTVISSSNPFNGQNPLDDAFSLIEEICREKGFDDYKVYYFGTSNGARIGITWGAKYPQIKKFILINSPLMVNWHQLRKGLEAFRNTDQELWLIYGTEDPSYKYIELLYPFSSDKIHLECKGGADHYFSQHLSDFINYPKDKFFAKKGDSNAG